MNEPVKVKPIVNYYSDFPHNYIVVGESASVIALDHPYLGKQWVRTSTVLHIDNGSFETKNTLYVPVIGFHTEEAYAVE